MKILTVCQHYWPEHFQITDICEELVQRGHEVTALVGIPNYPDGIVPEEYQDGHNRIQEHNGVCIIRSKEIPRKSGIIGLSRNYFSYMESAKHIARHFCEGEFDVIFGYQTSPVFMFAPVADAKRSTGAPAMLYCADIWPDAVRAMLPKKFEFLMPAIRRVSTSIYSAADLVATNSSAYIDCFKEIHGFDRSCLYYVPQYADDTYLDMDFTPTPHDKTRLMVIGNIGRLQDMPSMLYAINRLKDRGDFELHIVGTGSAIGWCHQFVEAEGLEPIVTFYGHHPFEEMPFFYKLADACLLTLNVPNAPWISSTLPSRLQGYMAAGKPVLAAVSGSAADVISDSGCGKTVPAGDDKAYANLIADYLDNRSTYEQCGCAGRNYFRQFFMRKRYMDTIERLLKQLSEKER